MKKVEVMIKNFSLENDYFIIDFKGCYTCLVPVDKSAEYKAMFENCKTNEEIAQVIDSLKR